jgi:poly(3-hydroxybutyrate) depolymerase
VAPAEAAVSSGTTRRLGNSTDPIAAAVDLSRGAWEDGAATFVALGRADLFPDSLAGAALAGMRGPMLFTTGGDSASLAPTVRDEIVRVLPPPEGCSGEGEIAVLGGTGAISGAVESELASLGYCVTRLGGASRVETALLVAREVLDRGGDGSRVLLASAANWPDAATGSAYAAATGHPIVVTFAGALDPAVAAFLQATAPEEIVLLGGTGALSAAVEDAASAIAPTRRVAGTSRDATAVAIAEELWGPLAPRGVMLVNGFAADGWVHAIAGAVNAALDGAAELFVDAASLPPTVTEYLAGVDDEFSIVAGPPERVGDAVVATIEATRGLQRPPGDAPLRYRDRVFTDVVKSEDIVYGVAESFDGFDFELLMNVYEPAGDTVTERPVILWAHGGSFFIHGRALNEDFFTQFVEYGYVVASIDYRIVPAPGCAGTNLVVCGQGVAMATDDAQTALHFLSANADEYGIDPTRMAMSGISAGGIMAMNAAFARSEEPDVPLRAVVPIVGCALFVGASPGDAPSLLFNAKDDSVVEWAWAEGTVASSVAAGVPSIHRTWETGGHNAWNTHREQIIDETTSFLWWQLDLQGAAR